MTICANNESLIFLLLGGSADDAAHIIRPKKIASLNRLFHLKKAGTFFPSNRCFFHRRITWHAGVIWAHLFLSPGGGGRPIYLTMYHMFSPVSVTYFRIYDVVTFYILYSFLPGGRTCFARHCLCDNELLADLRISHRCDGHFGYFSVLCLLQYSGYVGTDRARGESESFRSDPGQLEA